MVRVRAALSAIHALMRLLGGPESALTAALPGAEVLSKARAPEVLVNYVRLWGGRWHHREWDDAGVSGMALLWRCDVSSAAV